MNGGALMIPKSYKPALTVRETQRAIRDLRYNFQDRLAAALNLERISAPMFVTGASGLNDNLNGVERPVSFDIPDIGESVEVVHSLAKWKRAALRDYGFKPGEGLYTDMNAIRRDETLDNLHSVYVDQWDWEAVIDKSERTEQKLRETVCAIYGALRGTSADISAAFPAVGVKLPTEVAFITSQELENMLPSHTPKQREDEIARRFGAAFIMQIGAPLKSGAPHDGRAPDYDDWSLNGDLLVWSDVLGSAIELSSMGIRVDEDALDRQLTAAGCNDRRALPFHRALLAGELPYTMGGGIGQSRVCMYLLGKAHIGEVQASVWPQDMVDKCRDAGIHLL